MLQREIGGRTMARKWKLKHGLSVCNVTVERAGKIVSVKCEAGRIYEGEEFAKWCPSVMAAVPDAVIHSLPTPPPHRPLREKTEPEIRPSEVIKAVGIDLKATMVKKHVEDPTPPIQPEIPPEPPASEDVESPIPPPVVEKPHEKKGKLRKRGR
jgi:hypothetical protein